MHDVTHYPWVRPEGGKVDATAVPSARNDRGELAMWRADVPHEQAMNAPLGSALTAVDVYANHGRWIVECPDCKDAQLASRDDRRFMCVGCANASVGGVWRPVNWPKDHEVITALLDVRPMNHTKNWVPGEKVADLRRENKERGVA